nr:PREDICTED: plasminogen-like [Notothenia coriiceps]
MLCLHRELMQRAAVGVGGTLGSGEDFPDLAASECLGKNGGFEKTTVFARVHRGGGGEVPAGTSTPLRDPWDPWSQTVRLGHASYRPAREGREQTEWGKSPTQKQHYPPAHQERTRKFGGTDRQNTALGPGRRGGPRPCAAKCEAETIWTCRSFLYIEKDQDCWTAAANSKTETILRRSSAALYEKKVYLLECVNGIGTDYRGTKSKSKTGKICQRWEAKYPHRPNFTPDEQPRADLESNFCRNPDVDSGGPWCYTTDSNTRWESCDVPSCTALLLRRRPPVLEFASAVQQS